MLESISDDKFKDLRVRLVDLSLNPPQTLLLEGGSETQRLDMALYWAMAANCPTALLARQKGKSQKPCLTCSVCRQLAANENRDLLILDGRISNKQDEDKPGPVRALRMENVRELKEAIAARPNGEGKRVVILQGMGRTREEALNGLLKTLEEPSEYTLFVLLTPQREQILPTLVSRSFCLTLSWLDSNYNNKDVEHWETSLAAFLGNGSDFLDKISAKGALDAQAAAQILLSCQRSLARAAGNDKETSALDKIFRKFAQNPEHFSLLSRWLSEAHNMLSATVNPARVLEAFGSKLYILLREKVKRAS